MDRFTLQIETELELMSKYNLSAEEMFMIYLFAVAKLDNNYTYLNEYVSIKSRFNDKYKSGIPFELLESLNDKGVIKKFIMRKGEDMNLEDIKFNDLFLKKYFRASNELGIELYSVYPDELYINGFAVDSKQISSSSKYHDIIDLFKSYSKIIKHNPKVHKEIISLVEYGKENNLLNCNLCTFVSSQGWLYLQKCRDNGNGVLDNNEMMA